MFWTEGANAVEVCPTPSEATTTTERFFQSGNPQTGRKATIVDADWLNMVQSEINNVIKAAGLTLDKADWTQLLQAIPKLMGSGNYEAIPHTLALRNEEGCTEVGDAKFDMQAVNLRTIKRLLVQYIGVKVVAPTILSPEDGANGVPLACNVTVSDLRLTDGDAFGTASWFRVLNSRRSVVYDSGLVPYTTNHMVNLDAVSEVFTIEARHYDNYCEWSPWSEPVEITSAPYGILAPEPLSPINNALDEAIVGLRLITKPLRVLGSTVQPAMSQFRYSTFSDMDGAIDSGEISYTEQFDTVRLQPNTQYYWQARHKDSALGWSGWSNVATFKTMASKAPDATELTHTIPGGAKQGTQITFTISGATSEDGGDVFYDLEKPTGGLSFSKNSGIVDGEEITMHVPTIEGVTQQASVNIVARSEFGASAKPVGAEVVILAQTIWIFNTPGRTTFTPPATLVCDVYVGGPGAGAWNNNDYLGGGGGGCAILRGTVLTQGTVYGLVVGSHPDYPNYTGTTSSFNAAVIATTGQGKAAINSTGYGGQGSGGTENYTGGACAPGNYQPSGGGAGVGNGNGRAAGPFIPELGYATGGDGNYGSCPVANSAGLGSVGGGGGGLVGSASSYGGVGSVVIVARLD